MAQKHINTSAPNDNLGDTLRDANIKCEDNFTELYTNKVDKISGKGLSTNDYTTAEKTKLSSIPADAEKNVQADFLVNDPDSDAYIKNKPDFITQVNWGDIQGDITQQYDLQAQFDSMPDFEYVDGKVSQSINDGVYTSAPSEDAVNAAFLLKQDLNEKDQANGYAGLDSAGKILTSQLPNSVMEYKGVYDASTNTPELTNGIGNTGDVYRVTVSGSGVNNLNFVVGDYVVYNGTTWEKQHSGADNVVSVFGRAGVVTAENGDYTTAQVTEATNKNYQTDVQKLYNDATSSIQNQLNNKQGLISGVQNFLGKFTSGTGLATSQLYNTTNLLEFRPVVSTGTDYFRFGTYAANGLYGSYIKTGYNYASNINTNIQLGVSSGGTAVDAVTIDHNGNVGVGTVEPADRLDVAGRIISRAGILSYASANENYLQFRNADGTNIGLIGSDGAISASNTKELGLYVYDNNPMSFWSNSVKRMSLTGNGDLGLGTSAPASKLHVHSTNSNIASFSDGYSGNNKKMIVGTFGNGVSLNATDWDTNTARDLAFATNSGNVGIGTTSPLAKLHIAGGSEPLRLQHDSAYISFYNTAGSTRGGYIQNIANNSMIIMNEQPTDLQLGTNGAVRMTINGGGNVGIGADPVTKLDVYQNNNSSAFIVRNGTNEFYAGNDADGAYIGGYKVDNSGTVPLQLQKHGGNVGIGIGTPNERLHVIGNILSSGAVYAGSLGASLNGVDNVKLTTSTNGNSSLVFETALTERMRLNADGKLGIGTSAPKGMLDVESGIQTDTPTVTDAGAYLKGVDVGVAFGQLGAGNNYASWMQSIRRSDNGSFNLAINPNGGNVGIGVKNPATTLAIKKGTPTDYPTLGGGIGSFSMLGDTALYGLYGGVASDGNTWLQSMRNDSALAYNIILQPAGGNIGIGTSAPTHKVDINVGSDVNVKVFNNSGYGELVSTNGSNSDYKPLGLSGKHIIMRTNDGSTKAVLDPDGNFAIGNTTANAISGYKNLIIGRNASEEGGLLKFSSTYNSGNGAQIYQGSNGTLFFDANTSVNTAYITAGGLLHAQSIEGQVSIEIGATDLNDLNKVGFYKGAGLANAPGGSSEWFYITCESHGSGWIKQTATSYGGGANAIAGGTTYIRVLTDSVNWSSWQQLATNSFVQSSVNSKASLGGSNTFTGVNNFSGGVVVVTDPVNPYHAVPKNYVDSNFQPKLAYKTYVATMYQSGTNAPTATIMENTIGSISWARTGVGTYRGTLSGAFTTGKTTVFLNPAFGTGNVNAAQWNTTSTIDIKTLNGLSPTDGILTTDIEIRVYN